MAIQTDEIKAINERIERESVVVQTITAEVSKAIVGQQYLVQPHCWSDLLANGHILIEGVPGSPRRTRSRTLAAAIKTPLPAHPVHAGPAARRTSSAP